MAALAVLVLGVCGAAARAAGIAPSHAAAITTLLEMSGVFARARSGTDAMVARLAAANPRIPAAVWRSFAARISARDALQRTYVPVYARHLPEEVARGMISFYRTPVGARFLAADPGIQEETRRMAQTLAMRLAGEILTGAAAGPAAPAAPPAPPDGRTAAIHELLRVSGSLRTGTQVMLELLGELQESQGDTLPPELWEGARRRLGDEEQLLQLWTPAYARFLPAADVQVLIGFYRGPTGARFAAALPAIQHESRVAAELLAHDAARGSLREVLGPLPRWALSHPHSAFPAGGAGSSGDAAPVWSREPP